MTSDGVWSIEDEGLTLVATHRVLRDVARDIMAAFAGGGPLARPVVLHVGAHRSQRLADRPGALQIGLQTEQMLDEAGNRLWKAFQPGRIVQMLAQYDLLLDLSEANAPAYGFLDAAQRRRVRFGPFLFPAAPPAPRGPGEGLLFVGAMNERRADRLAALGARVVTLPDRTFGPAVAEALERCEGLLNLHFQDAVYSEYPRLLKAVLAGRAVWSEPLAAPLVEGVHYFAPTARPAAAEVAAVQRAMAELFATRFALRSFLRDEIARATPA
ncbi:MAG: hypothetical protein O9292_16075 [Rhodobacteraceae bacterium]|nr:hypothetical protein [Paracoccaceae bacterium]